MALARLIVASLALGACAKSQPAASADDSANGTPHAKPAALVFGDAPPGEFVSKRFGLHLRLPDGRGWRIDDHKTEHLTASHALAATALRATRFRAGALSGLPITRDVCWDEAISRGVFDAVSRSESLVDHDEKVDDAGDARLTVSIGRTGDVGRVRWVRAHGDSCVAVGIVSKRLAGDTDETLGQRLALLREKVIGGLSGREKEAAPRATRPWTR